MEDKEIDTMQLLDAKKICWVEVSLSNKFQVEPEKIAWCGAETHLDFEVIIFQTVANWTWVAQDNCQGKQCLHKYCHAGIIFRQ